MKHVSEHGGLNYVQWLQYQLNYRDSWGRLLGGLVVIIGVLIAYHRLGLSREEQMTNRFSKAVELLGHEKMSVRLGALYALERIANDSEKDYPAIIETLGAYVRDEALRPSDTPEQQRGLKEDINAAINILGRRKNEDPKPSLAFTDLSGLRLTSAPRNFSGFVFTKAALNGAKLNKAALNGAKLNWAKLTGAALNGAKLNWAKLTGADLIEVDLIGAELNGAKLNLADLTEADLTGATGLTWDMLKEAKDLTDAMLPEELMQDPPKWYRKKYLQQQAP